MCVCVCQCVCLVGCNQSACSVSMLLETNLPPIFFRCKGECTGYQTYHGNDDDDLGFQTTTTIILKRKLQLYKTYKRKKCI